MGYLEELRPASFRGVPFWVDDSALNSGKRAQVHEYAERDDWFVEELGAKAETFPVTAHLIGDDVFQQRDALIAALKLPGPGTLVLPVDGEIEAHCLDFRAHDSITSEGRISRLNLTFVRAGKNQFPEPTVDTREIVLDQGDTGVEALRERFFDLFDMPALNPTFVVTAAVEMVTAAVDAIDDAIRRADADTDAKDTALRTNATFLSDLVTIVQTPRTLASNLTASYRSFVDLGQPARTIMSELEDLGAVLDTFSMPSEATVHRRREGVNQRALQDLNRRTAAVEMARAATRVDLVSSADAAAVRDQVDAALDVEILAAGDAGDDQVFAELRELRANSLNDLDTRGARLPAVRTFRVPATLPALVIANQLYDDPTRDSEIIDRNSIRAPGFVRAQSDLEVLAE